MKRNEWKIEEIIRRYLCAKCLACKMNTGTDSRKD